MKNLVVDECVDGVEREGYGPNSTEIECQGVTVVNLNLVWGAWLLLEVRI